MILTTEQQRRITDAGGWVNPNGPAPDSTGLHTVAIVKGVYLLASPADDYDVAIPTAPHGWHRTYYSNLSMAIGRAIGEAEVLATEPYPQLGFDDDPCNVLQFPMPSTTRLGAIESFLDRHADRAGDAVARAMRNLANLARRADNARKGRRNG
jgi:hypothetical protein